MTRPRLSKPPGCGSSAPAPALRETGEHTLLRGPTQIPGPPRLRPAGETSSRTVQVPISNQRLLGESLALELRATVGVPVPPGATQAWVDAHVAAVAADDTYQPVRATIAGGRALLHITLASSECAKDGRCRVGGAPIMVVAPAMPEIRAP